MCVQVRWDSCANITTWGSLADAKEACREDEHATDLPKSLWLPRLKEQRCLTQSHLHAISIAKEGMGRLLTSHHLATTFKC